MIRGRQAETGDPVRTGQQGWYCVPGVTVKIFCTGAPAGAPTKRADNMGPPRQEIPNSFKRNTWDNALEQLKGAVMGVQQEGQETRQDHVPLHQGFEHEP